MLKLAQTGQQFTVRSSWDRLIEATGNDRQHLRQWLAQRAPGGRYVLEVSAGPNRTARSARMVVRWACVAVRLRNGQGHQQRPLRVTAVWAREQGTCPRGEEPLDGLLLTSVSVRSLLSGAEHRVTAPAGVRRMLLALAYGAIAVACSGASAPPSHSAPPSRATAAPSARSALAKPARRPASLAPYSCAPRNGSPACARVRERNLAVATTAAGQAGPSNECSYPVDAEELVDYLGYCDTAPAGSSWYIALRSVKFLCPGWEAEWNVVHEDALGNRAIYHAPRSATVTYTLAPLHGELRWFEQPTGPGTHYLESYPPCAFDYDGDGDPELVLAASRLILCSTSTAAVLTHADGRVVQYAPAKGLGVDGLVDVDGDGRPDLLTAVGFDVNCETEPLHGDCARLHWPLPLHARADGSFAVDETIWPLLRERCAAARSRPSLLARAKDGNVDEEATADGVLCALLWGTEPAAIEQQLERECGMAMRHACDTETPNACPRWLRDLASVPLPVAGSFCRVGGGVESCPAEPAPRPGPPGPASTAVAMVHIPGGSFLMGSSHVKPKEVAAHRVTVDGFEIDKTEVTVAEYARCVNAGKCSKPATDTSCDPRPSWPLRGTMEICLEGAVSTECNWGHAGREDHPVNCVDWNEASVYCRWVGKRLPTEQEWEYAARGSDGRTYPWGNAKRRSQTCSSRSGTCPVGSHASDASPFGVLDMAANVMEWTSSPYCDFPSPIPGDPCSDWAVVRGGDVVSLEPSAVRGMQSPRTRSWIIGFRCVR